MRQLSNHSAVHDLLSSCHSLFAPVGEVRYDDELVAALGIGDQLAHHLELISSLGFSGIVPDTSPSMLSGA